MKKDDPFVILFADDFNVDTTLIESNEIEQLTSHNLIEVHHAWIWFS